MDPPAAGLPARRDRRRRLERDHQARRHRRRGHRRHRHRAAGLRDPVDPLPQPRRHHRTSTRSGSRQDGPDRVAITGVRGEAPPERLKVCVNELGGFRNTVEFVLTGLDIEAKADWVREQLTPGADRRATVTWSRVALPPADADTEEGASVPAPVHGRWTRSPTRSASAFTGAGGRARAGVVPRLHDDRPAAPAHAVRRLPAGVRRPRARSRTPSCTPTAGARWSPTRPSSPTADHDARPAAVAVPRARRLAHPPDAARHVRARPLRRQGRRRQPRAVGRQRRRPPSTTPGSPGWPS